MNLLATLHPFSRASKVITVMLAVATCVLITSSMKAGALTKSVSASASGDTQIRSANPNTNYGSATTITVDGDEPAGTGKNTAALIRFSLPTLPAGATITDAKLRLNVTNSSTNTYSVFVMKKAWVESETTWNKYKNGRSWELAGGRGATDRESPAIASITPNTTGVRDFDLGAAFDQQVGDWMRGVEANNGIQIINVDASDGFDFFTREAATASQRPQLVITYDDGNVADTTPPETTITSDSTEGGTLPIDSATFGFSSSEANNTFACSLDGAAYSPCSSPKSYSSLADGPHTFSVRATDAAGNTDATPASRTWTVDTIAPDTMIDSGPSGLITVTDATFSFSSSEAEATFECRLDGATYSACTSPESFTNLSNGLHTFDVRAKDEAGNVDATPASSTFTVDVPPPPQDTTPPETIIDSGPSGTVENGEATFNFSSSEPNSTFECSLDDAAFDLCTSPKAYTGLGNGQHTFEVRARDALGNVDATPATRSWTVVLPAPPPPPSGTLEKFEPPDGTLYAGVDADQRSGDTTMEINIQKWQDWVALMNGLPPAISHTFTGYDANMTWDTDVAKARGATPLISWQTGSTSPKTIANAGVASSGNRSDYVIMKVASALRAYNEPVFLRVDQEMNAYWFAWSAYNSDGSARAHTTEDFKDMWRRMVIIFRGGKVSDINAKLAAEGMPPLDPAVGTSAASKGYPSTTDPDAVFPATDNVAFVFNPVDAPGVPNVAGNRWDDYYPGDAYVDWVGQTTYDTTWNATIDQRFAWLDQFYQDFAVGHDKPYMMGEWGLEPVQNAGGGDDPAYIQRMIDWQKAHPQVKALVYFSVLTSHGDYRLSTYPNSVPVLANAVTDPRFLRTVEGAFASPAS